MSEPEVSVPTATWVSSAATAIAEPEDEPYPWLIAFTFGLLHGFGFAGALEEIGLPQADVPLALLTFNLEVEAGQLLFVAAVFAVCRIGATIARPVASPLRTVAAYAIGTLATVWFIERLDALSLS